MRFVNSLVLALITLLFLVGCLAGGGGPANRGGTDYDGVWRQLSYADSTFVKPTAGTNQLEVCDKPPVPITIVNGFGSVRQNYSCNAVYTDASSAVAAGLAIAGDLVPGTGIDFYYLIGVSISASKTGDILTAQVNGATFTGTCTLQSCAAQTTTGGLSMIR
jgi:hypothetical protein